MISAVIPSVKELVDALQLPSPKGAEEFAGLPARQLFGWGEGTPLANDGLSA
jgi:hypothetical protein